MKKPIAGVCILLVLSSIAYIGWVNEWFVSTPTSVVTNALMQANAGNYEAASKNLPMGERKQLLDDPKLMRAVWDTITKKRTIDAITITREDRGPTGTFGDIELNIRYKDGSTRSAQTKIGCDNGIWTFGSAELNNAIVAQDRKDAMDAFGKRQIVPAKEFSRIGKSKVLLRVPEGLVWDPGEQAYHHPKLDIHIFLRSRPGADFTSLVRIAEQEWKSPTLVLERHEDLSKDQVKAMVFDGDAINEKGRGWRRMCLVIGDKHQSAWISTTFPNLDNYRRAMRECFSTARWESDDSK